jgi:hypothetical protein
MKLHGFTSQDHNLKNTIHDNRANVCDGCNTNILFWPKSEMLEYHGIAYKLERNVPYSLTFYKTKLIWASSATFLIIIH